jgi:hypothetical protein
MRKMWLPLWLYQLLPVIYLLSGLLMLANFGSEPLGLVSGSMLCAAGLLILVLRIYGANKASTRER